MGLGLGLLGFSPAHFWSLTPKELEAAIHARFGRSPTPTPLGRSHLNELMHRFPDAPPKPPLVG